MNEPPDRERTMDGWAVHDAEQRVAWQRTTPRQRLEWLEDAKRFARRAQEAAARRHGGARDDEGPAAGGS